MKEKIKEIIKKEKFKTITIVIANILLAFDLLLFITNGIEIFKLNFPLTGISLSLLFIITGIILVLYNITINQFQKGKRCKKAFRLLAILVVIDISIYILSPIVNNYITKNGILVSLGETKEYHLNGIKYKVSKSWKTEEETLGNSIFYYSHKIDSLDGHILTMYDTQKKEDLVSLEDYVDETIKNFKKEEIKISYQKKKNIKGMKGIEIKFKTKKGIEKINIFYNPKNLTFYEFSMDSTQETKGFNALYEKLLNSIVIDKNYSTQNEEEQEEINIESDDEINNEDEINQDLSIQNENSKEKENTIPNSNNDDYSSTSKSNNEEKSSNNITQSTSQQQALKSAKQYLNTSAFSHDGLIEQLKFEGFSDVDATYGADNCGANWNQQAVKAAKQYLDTSAFSYEGLKKQLEFEKYTSSEATYGVDHCDADWNQQAVKAAKQYLDTMAFSRAGLIEQLKYEGFTQSQAEYGVSQNGL